ncbi:MAG: hypothetical protein IPM29_23645 [Planctomycetes bacterium]|nr:hypothetical protein [Planctomycetota bacterium]
MKRLLALGALVALLFSLPSCYGFGFYGPGGHCGAPRLNFGPIWWPHGGRGCR